MRHWTQAERQRQAELIKQWQPWNKSTGAKTIEGKAISSRTAFKGGLRSTLQKVAKFLREQKQAINLF